MSEGTKRGTPTAAGTQSTINPAGNPFVQKIGGRSNYGPFTFLRDLIRRPS